MCEFCLDVITQGNRPPMTDQMWTLAAIAWDWYQLPGNDCGGELHVVLDDMNVEDDCLAFCRNAAIRAAGLGPIEHLAERVDPDVLLLIASTILDGLQELTEPERAMVVHFADVYGSKRPRKP